MKLIVGLGNYESKYDITYHNLGFMVVDSLCKEYNASFTKQKCSAMIAETNINNEKVVFAKPLTYMNLSGKSVREFITKFKISLDDILIIYDDIDIPLGKVRFRENGSGGSHNGMKNVIEQIGSQSISRLRVGSGKPNLEIPLVDYVLSHINKEDLEKIKSTFDDIKKMVETFINKKHEK